MTPAEITSLIDVWAADEHVQFLTRNAGHYTNSTGSYAALRLLVERAVAAERAKRAEDYYTNEAHHDPE